jgi:hypothetical protein
MAIFDSSDEEEEDKAKEDAKKMKNSPDGSYLRQGGQAAMKALKNRGKIVSLTSFILISSFVRQSSPRRLHRSKTRQK